MSARFPEQKPPQGHARESTLRRGQQLFGRNVAVRFERGDLNVRVLRKGQPERRSLRGKLRLQIAVEQHGCDQKLAAFAAALAARQVGKPTENFFANAAQLLRQLRHADGLEQIGHDLVFNALLGVFKIVIAAEKGNLDERLCLACLPRQRCAGDEGHANVREQEIRLHLLDEL